MVGATVLPTLWSEPGIDVPGLPASLPEMPKELRNICRCMNIQFSQLSIMYMNDFFENRNDYENRLKL